MKNSELFLPHGSALPFSKRHENISGFLDPLTLLPQANIEIATPFVIQRNYSTWRSWGIRCSNVSCQSNVKQQMRTFIYGIALMEKSVPNHLNRILAFESLRWCMHARFWFRCPRLPQLPLRMKLGWQCTYMCIVCSGEEAEQVAQRNLDKFRRCWSCFSKLDVYLQRRLVSAESDAYLQSSFTDCILRQGARDFKGP